MRPLAIVFAALAGLLVACTSGEGPASVPFSPLGTEPAPSTTEPKSGGNETPPSGGSSIEELCFFDCERISSKCAIDACDDAFCADIEAAYPDCRRELLAYFACVAKAPIECTQYDRVDIPSCEDDVYALSICLNN